MWKDLLISYPLGINKIAILLLVASETVSLGSRYECQQGENRLVYNTYNYVSVEKNLRSLLHNKDFV